jgi:hypothetical protein
MLTDEEVLMYTADCYVFEQRSILIYTPLRGGRVGKTVFKPDSVDWARFKSFIKQDARELYEAMVTELQAGPKQLSVKPSSVLSSV